jgi:putative phage-type endonuclease
MKAIVFDQRSYDWLNWKKGGVGASESGSIAAAIGLLPEPASWTDTIQTLWEHKVGLRPPKKMHPGMMRGVMYEDDAIDSYHTLTGNTTSPLCGEMDKDPFIQASFDGLTFDLSVILETKVPNQDVIDLAASKIVAPYYVPQCAHQCMVAWGHPDEWPANSEHHFYAYQPETNTGHLVARPSNDYKQLAEKMYPAIQAFWQNVLDRVPPCGDTWLQAAIRYRIASAALDRAKADEEDAKAILLDAFPKMEVRTYSGGGVTVTKSTKAGKIQYAKYVKDKNINEADLEKYRGKSSNAVYITVNENTPMPNISDAVQLAIGQTKDDLVSQAWPAVASTP